MQNDNRFRYYNDYSFLNPKHSFYQMLASIFVSFPICRIYEEFNKQFCSLPLFYYPLKFNPTNYSISDILDIMGLQFLQLNKPIYVCCSGGVDSTCILVSLLKNSNRKIGILYNNHSIIENKLLFEFLIKNVRIESLPCNLQVIDNLLSKDFIVLTGTPADIIIQPPINEKYNNISYKEYILKYMMNEFFILDKYKNKKCLYDFIEKSEYLCSLCPVPIYNARDFWWWIGISTSYNGLNHIWHCTTSNKVYPINFYDNQLFIDYSIINHTDNKKEMIQYCTDFFKKEDIIQKQKIKSANMLNEYEDNLICIKSDKVKIMGQHNRYEYSYKKHVKYMKLARELKQEDVIEGKLFVV